MSVIFVESVYRKDGNYYPKAFLEKNIIHSDDCNDSNDSNEKIPTKKIKCINLYLKNKQIDHQSSSNNRNFRF